MIPHERNRKTSQRRTFIRQVLLVSFVIAFALNLTWEMLQMPAYTRFAQSSLQAWLFCGLAAIFDTLYVIFLYWLGKRLTRKENWIFHLTWLDVFGIILLGIITATIVERIALTLSFWSYSKGMLEVPLLQVGILPLIQLIALPLATFWLVGRAIESQDTSGQ